VTNGMDMDQQTANVVEALKQAAAVLEPHGLVMVCEPLNWRDHHGQFLRYTPQSIAIMKAVDSPACQILQDLYHQQATEGNLIDHMNAAWDDIPYFQVGDNPGRREPGTGEINYANVFKHMHQRGYTGIVGMEHGKSQGGKAGELTLIEAYRAVDPG
jgi:hydroxypyruvate isomerase